MDTVIWNLVRAAVVSALILFVINFLVNLFSPSTREALGEDSTALDVIRTAFGRTLVFVFASRTGLVTLAVFTAIYCARQAFSPASANFWGIFLDDKFNIPSQGQVAWRWTFFASVGLTFLVSKLTKQLH